MKKLMTMKKEFVIQIQSVKDSLRDFAKVYKKLERGEKINPVEKLTFTNINDFRKFITGKRLELLKTIKQKNPNSIQQLAKMLNRDYKSINIDLQILQKMDLVSKKRENNKTVLEVNYSEIGIKIPLMN